MNKLLGIVILSLLMSGNAYAKTMNEWIKTGYKVTNEDLVQKKGSSYATKIFTLTHRRGFIVICTVRISGTGSIRRAECEKQ